MFSKKSTEGNLPDTSARDPWRLGCEDPCLPGWLGISFPDKRTINLQTKKI